MKHKQTAPPPVIDERIEFRGTSFLRTLTAEALKELDNIIVLQDGAGSERLAVLMPYAQYMRIQKAAAL